MKLFLPALLTRMNRRRFLSAAAAATACSDAGAEPPPEPLVVQIRPAQRPQTDVEAWNVGLISAYRAGLTSAENHARDQRLSADICRSPFGRLLVRGCYIENCRSGDARAVDVRAYLLVGDPDDSGNLKGFLRKLGRAYEQDAVVYKNYYRDAELHALSDLPDVGMANREKRSLGPFSPDLVGHYFTLMTRRGAPPLSLDKLCAGWDGEDWLGGRWEDIGFWTPKSFSARAERRVYFEGCSFGRWEAIRTVVTLARRCQSSCRHLAPTAADIGREGERVLRLGGERLRIEQKDFRVPSLADQLD